MIVSGIIASGYFSVSVGPVTSSWGWMRPYDVSPNTEYTLIYTTLSSSLSSPQAFRWTSSGGWGSKLSDVGTVPGQTIYGTAFTPDVNAVIAGSTASPHVHVYGWSNSSGFGTKFANPSSALGGNCTSMAFNSNGSQLALCRDGTSAPHIRMYRWSNSGFGTAYTAPSTALGGSVVSLAFSSGNTTLTSNSLFIGIQGSNTIPRVNAYRVSADGWGTRYAAPSSLPGQSPSCIQVSPCSVGSTNTVWFGHGTTLRAYDWSYSGGWGTSYTTEVAGIGARNSIDLHPLENAIATAASGTPQLEVVGWNYSTKWGTFFANPAQAESGNAFGTRFSPDGNAIVFGHTASTGLSPRLKAYAWSNSGFGATYSAPAVTVTSSAIGMSFSIPDHNFTNGF
jgi:hypothetical protein